MMHAHASTGVSCCDGIIRYSGSLTGEVFRLSCRGSLAARYFTETVSPSTFRIALRQLRSSRELVDPLNLVDKSVQQFCFDLVKAVASAGRFDQTDEIIVIGQSTLKDTFSLFSGLEELISSLSGQAPHF